MARGVDTSKTFVYILESDRALPEKEQTVWHLKPYGSLNTFQMEKRWQNSQILTPTGKTKIDVNARRTATLETFIEFVAKIENFFFHGEEEGSDIESHDIHNMRRVCEQLKPQWWTELLEAANGGAEMPLDEKKPSNSQPTSKAGAGIIPN